MSGWYFVKALWTSARLSSQMKFLEDLSKIVVILKIDLNLLEGGGSRVGLLGEAMGAEEQRGRAKPNSVDTINRSYDVRFWGQK